MGRKRIIRRANLYAKFAVLFAAVIVLVLGFNVGWRQHTQQEQTEREMLEKAQVLAHEMDAVWDFMERNQNQFKTDADGHYTLYCVVAAKSISRSFTGKTDYIIHYTNTQTRKKADSPDAFELEALAALKADRGLDAYYALTTDDEGYEVFRYVEPLEVTESCLSCHGEPAGELDELGYPKEGQKVGDIAGAASIIMPVDVYLQNSRASLVQETIVFALVLIGGLAAIFFGIARLVTRPMRRLGEAAARIEHHDFNVDLEGIGDRDEVEDLARSFDSMAVQLQELYDDLEQKVDVRTAELARANELLEAQRHQLEAVNEKLKDESQYKSDFLAIMSHELRTPLTSILAFADLWEQANAPRDEGERIAVREIKENGRLLQQMIGNILEMARVEAGRITLTLEAVDLRDLLAVVEGTVGFIAEKRGIDLVVAVSDDMPVIRADFEKLRRIIENLASNALKFTEPGGSVRIDCTYEAAADCAVIRVADTGVGIKADDLPTIFDRFVQGDGSAERRYGGSGLGLAVVRELVELHGGSVEVESTEGAGSVFTVRIDAATKGWEAS